MRVVRGVELVERVEDEDDALCGSGFSENLLEMGGEVLDVERQGFGAAGDEGEFVAEAAERATLIGGAGAGADEMRDEETSRWGERAAELCEEGGLAGAGVAGEDEDGWRAVSGGKGEHLTQQRVVAADDETLGALLDERFHLLRFVGKFVGRRGAIGREARGEFRIVLEALEEIGMHALAKRFESGEPLLRGVPFCRIDENWEFRVGDRLLQSREFRGVVAAVNFAEITGRFLDHPRRRVVITEVKERMSALLLLAAQHTIMHFIRRDGMLLLLRHPAIASAQHADEARVAFINDFAAYPQRILIASHAPSQIHIHEMDAVFHQFLSQLRKHEAHQMVALRLHVAERRGDEDADSFPICAHAVTNLK